GSLFTIEQIKYGGENMSVERKFRRKILSLSLATTLALGTFGVPALAATSTDQVNDHFEQDANKLYEDIFSGNEDALNSFRNHLQSFIQEVGPETVEDWFGPHFDQVQNNIG